MNTPQHVKDYNERPDAEWNGMHFDDPRFDSEVSAAKEMYEPEVKTPRPPSEVDHDVMANWLRQQTWSDFAVSLADFYDRRGYLTEKQYASAFSMRTKVEARQAERAKAEKDPNGLDLSDLPAGYYGVPGGDTRLKVRVNRPQSGKWEGFIFVDDGAEYGQRQKYGMQKPDGTYRGKIEDQLRTIAADPEAAGREYARLTNRCYACNRMLEDELSVELGIGPICRSK